MTPSCHTCGNLGIAYWCCCGLFKTQQVFTVVFETCMLSSKRIVVERSKSFDKDRAHGRQIEKCGAAGKHYVAGEPAVFGGVQP